MATFSTELIQEVEKKVSVVYLVDNLLKAKGILKEGTYLTAKTQGAAATWPFVNDIIIYGVTPREVKSVTSMLHLWVAMQVSSEASLEPGDEVRSMDDVYFQHVYMIIPGEQTKHVTAKYLESIVYKEEDSPLLETTSEQAYTKEEQ